MDKYIILLFSLFSLTLWALNPDVGYLITQYTLLYWTHLIYRLIYQWYTVVQWRNTSYHHSNKEMVYNLPEEIFIEHLIFTMFSLNVEKKIHLKSLYIRVLQLTLFISNTLYLELLSISN